MSLQTQPNTQIADKADRLQSLLSELEDGSRAMREFSASVAEAIQVVHGLDDTSHDVRAVQFAKLDRLVKGFYAGIYAAFSHGRNRPEPSRVACLSKLEDGRQRCREVVEQYPASKEAFDCLLSEAVDLTECLLAG